MDVILNVTLLLALALALSLLIERALEVLKTGYDLIDSRCDLYKFWTKRTYKIRNSLENRLRVFEYVSAEKTAIVLDKFRSKLLNKTNSYSGEVPILSGDLVRAVYIKSISKIFAIGLGIAAAFAMKVDLVIIWQRTADIDTFKILESINTPAIRKLISGVIIGLGSSPVHKLISSLEKKREEKRKKQLK